MGNDTIFHKIMNGDIPATKVYEDELCFAIRDINPACPTHILVIPRIDLVSLAEATVEHKEILGHMLVVCSNIAKQEGLSENGYRVVINAGENAGQTVFQLHIHVLGGREMGWPPG